MPILYFKRGRLLAPLLAIALANLIPLAVLALSLGLALPVRAATITVNTTAQSPGTAGDCTLGEAIQAANSDVPVDGCTPGSGPDTIILAPTATYILTMADNITDGPNGLPSITSAITITGQGATIERSSATGTPNFRIFHLDIQGDLTLNDLTVHNGRASSSVFPNGAGGGVFNGAGGALTVTSSAFISNTAGVFGGGILNYGTLQVSDSSFNGNTATINGGAIDSITVMTVTNSTFDGNTAGFRGGGINNFATGGSNMGALTVIGSSFTGNVANAYGGGITNDGGIMVFVDSTVDGNSAGDNGGGIANAGVLTITNSTVNNNSAVTDGGGISNRTISSTLNITGTTVAGNSANNAGGGISNNGSTATVELINSTVISNEGDERGGGIYNVYGMVKMTNSTISGNSVPRINGIGGHGGGIYNLGGTVTLTESTVSGNSAVFSGGGMGSSGGLVEVMKSTVSGNTTQGNGGGIYSSGGSVNLTNSTVSGNTAIQNGGGIYSSAETTLALIHVTVSYNSASVGDGIANFSSVVNLTNTLVGDNLGADCDGAITSGGHNLDSDGTCNLIPALGDLPATATGLNPLLQFNSPGNTETHALLATSPAIDAADPAVCAAVPVNGGDQRGVLRPGTGTAGCDIGAYEFQTVRIFLPIILKPLAPPLALAVNSLLDEPDVNPGDTLCVSTPSGLYAAGGRYGNQCYSWSRYRHPT
jgi:CSLREA domain-containing protein